MSAIAKEIGNLRRKAAGSCTKSELIFKLSFEWEFFKGGVENNLAGLLNEIAEVYRGIEPSPEPQGQSYDINEPDGGRYM